MLYANLASSLLLQGRYQEAEQIYIDYKAELSEDFISDIIKFEELNIIPEEHVAEVNKIKRILQEYRITVR
jgi:hypothetical protein